MVQVSAVSLSNSPVWRFNLNGAQTVRTIQAAHERLIAAMAEHQAIEIHCSAVTELDLSLIQLVLAAKRSADKAGKSLRLAAPAAGKLRDALERAGFLAATDGETGGQAFWLKGTSTP
jgi:hypothetical protein